jgi:hypothetical protein
MATRDLEQEFREVSPSLDQGRGLGSLDMVKLHRPKAYPLIVCSLILVENKRGRPACLLGAISDLSILLHWFRLLPGRSKERGCSSMPPSKKYTVSIRPSNATKGKCPFPRTWLCTLERLLNHKDASFRDDAQLLLGAYASSVVDAND